MKRLGETLSILLPVVLLTVCFSFIYVGTYLPYMIAGTSFLLRTSVPPMSSFLRASVLPSSASTLLSVQPPTFFRFLTFIYWVLSISYFSHFVVTYLSYFAVSFISSHIHALSRSIFHFGYLMKRLGETLSMALPIVVITVVL